MELFTPSWLLIFLGLGLILVELAIGVQTGFDLVLIGLALVIGGGVGNWQGNWQLGLGVTAAVTILYLALARTFIRTRILGTTTKATNTDSLIGQMGNATQVIAPGAPGQIKTDHGEVWRAASSKPIPNGSRVRIVALEGVTVTVVQSR